MLVKRGIHARSEQDYLCTFLEHLISTEICSTTPGLVAIKAYEEFLYKRDRSSTVVVDMLIKQVIYAMLLSLKTSFTYVYLCSCNCGVAIIIDIDEVCRLFIEEYPECGSSEQCYKMCMGISHYCDIPGPFPYLVTKFLTELYLLLSTVVSSIDMVV